MIVDNDHRAITNSRGEFSISGLQSGIIEFTTRRIGYTPITSAVQVDSGTVTVHLAVKLVPIATNLGTIIVEGRRMDKALWQTGFYQRQATGTGQYFDDDARAARSAPISHDRDAQRRLWQLSEGLCEIA